MTTLFEEDAGFPNTLFHHLNTHRDAEGIRQRLEAWFAHFPAAGAERRDFLNKFRAKDNRQHHGAFFELYCHELLLRQGFEVQTHPQTSSRKNSSPDFLVSKNDQPLFYLECTICTYSNQADGIRTNEQEIVDYINANIRSQDFTLEIRFLEQTTVSPSKRDLRRRIEQGLESVDVELLRAIRESESQDEFPVIKWHHKASGWRVEVIVWPAQSLGDEIVAGISHPTETLTIKEPVKEDLRMKARHYGDLKLPLVIAIDNISNYPPDEEETAEILLGSLKYSYDIENRIRFAERQRDGFWKPGGNRHKGVGGVLIASNIKSTNFVHKDDICLWHQPSPGDDMARHELKQHWQGPQFIPISEGDAWGVRRQPGTSVLDLLNLR